MGEQFLGRVLDTLLDILARYGTLGVVIGIVIGLYIIVYIKDPFKTMGAILNFFKKIFGRKKSTESKKTTICTKCLLAHRTKHLTELYETYIEGVRYEILELYRLMCLENTRMFNEEQKKANCNSPGAMEKEMKDFSNFLTIIFSIELKNFVKTNFILDRSMLDISDNKNIGYFIKDSIERVKYFIISLISDRYRQGCIFTPTIFDFTRKIETDYLETNEFTSLMERMFNAMIECSKLHEDHEYIEQLFKTETELTNNKSQIKEF